MTTGARIWNAVNLQVFNYVMFWVRLDMRETKLNEWSLGKDIGNIEPVRLCNLVSSRIIKRRL